MSGLEVFFLVCFLVGVTLSVLSFIGGTWHLPHFHVHVPHIHLPQGHVAMPHPGDVSATGHASGAHQGADMPVLNFATITAFLAWFGGTGYLLMRYSTLVVSLILVIATAVGLVGAAIVFWFIAKLLLKHDRELDPADYERVGVLARVISSIREGGTGEIIFSQEGTRHTCGARSDTGEALARETEVIITRYEKGIAYVRRWDEMAGKTALGT
jgi:membrane protein implicated in regulation of membrane protease activity